ncbi:translocation/assembly module TamB [Flavobacteriaceae bacterium]|nr:translocation/assembly module TamB [Flavobacteriaceae bacterium]
MGFLSIPAIQTSLGSYATGKINNTYGTDIKIEKVGLQFNGDVELKTILIKDHFEATMISVSELNTSILSFAKIANNEFEFGDIDLHNLFFHIKTYEGEDDTSFDVFVDKFDRQNPIEKANKFLLSSVSLNIYNSSFRITNKNKNTPEVLDFKDLDILASDFLISESNINTKIKQLSFKDSRGVTLKNLQTDFSYTSSQMVFSDLQIETLASIVKGQLQLDYQRKDLKSFSEKVQVSGFFVNSNLDLDEFSLLYDEFGANQKVEFSTSFSGTLENLLFEDFNLNNSRNTSIIGSLRFSKLFAPSSDNFELDGKFEKISSNYEELVALLPRVLGNTIPSVFKALGRFNLSGQANVTKESVKAVMDVNTNIGDFFIDLNLYEIELIDNASYTGEIRFTDFNLGKAIGEPMIGLVTSSLRIDGSGFSKENISSDIKGVIDSFVFRGYDYSKLQLSGVVMNKVFNGQLDTADTNLKLNLSGLVDFSGAENIYDFSALIDYANLNALQLVARDQISILRGEMFVDMKGSSLDDAYGVLSFKDALYENQNDRYEFKDFKITSDFNLNRTRTIQVNSPEIVNGSLKGKFRINDLPDLIRNSLGDIYTKFNPFLVIDDQYLNFNFKIYSKIMELFYPDIKLGPNTSVKGRLESDPNKFKLTFKSPTIEMDHFYADKIKVQLINDNPLFNSYIEVDSLATKYYNASEFSLINVILNDTLYVKSEFKGGEESKDIFDLNLYYTTNEANKSVIGVKKSTAIFKEIPWLINSSHDGPNTITFDRDFKEVLVDNLMMSFADEEIRLNALVESSGNSSLDLEFKDVDISKVTPSIKNLKLDGNLNGSLNVSKTQSIYLPKSSLTIDDFKVNDFNLGSFKSNIQGNQSLTNYDVSVSLKEDDNESLSVVGTFDVSGPNSSLALDISFSDFILNPLNPFGADVITNIRGGISGFASVSGRLEKPQIDGLLVLNNGGLAIPYLNVGYDFADATVINLEKQSFIFDQAIINDVDYQSKAYLNGGISHNNFSNWSLDLNIDSDRLLVLNTIEQDESLYYGTALVDGDINISGPTDQLFIEANVGTSQGTIFKIPLNDSEILSESSYVNFLSPDQKLAQSAVQAFEIDDVKGLEMEFNMDINDNAEIEIIIDKQTGSSIIGRGNGSMLAQINTKGKFQMFGDFIVLSGIYNFSFGRIIQKKFKVVKDGTIAWDGSPLNADINIKALYDGINVNPSTLLDNPINQSIPTEVEVHLTGQLEKPDLNFDIRFPGVNSTLNSELADRLRDKDRKEFQALSLLATGAFRSELTLNSQDAFGLVSDGVTSMLNELFADDDNKVQLGIDLDLGKTTPDYETDSRLGVTVSTKINDNVLINGKVGVPVGGVSETTVAGDFEVEVLLNQDRTLTLKFFNKENSIQNFGEQIGYTQGVGLSYNIEFDNLKELLNALFKKQTKKINSKNTSEDDTALPEFMNFKENTPKKPGNN